VVEVESPGQLAATVTYSGDPLPVPTKVPVNINVETCGGKVFTENLLVDGETRGLKNAVIRLEGIERGKAPPEIVTVSNKHCAFVPHVAVAMKGTKLQLRNEDPVLHTTHPYINGANFFNKPLAAGAEPTRPRPIPKTGLMDIRCDVHKWMQAYIVIHSNPYLAVTDEKGKLIIDGIPAGKYTYTAWHEQLEESKGEVEIAAGQTAELVVTFDPPAEQ
jgi:plastocyanin